MSDSGYHKLHIKWADNGQHVTASVFGFGRFGSKPFLGQLTLKHGEEFGEFASALAVCAVFSPELEP